MMPSQLESSTVLIVDDNPHNLKLLLAFLNNFGVKVSVAKSGEAMLRMVQHLIPDLILLDVMMPGLNGFEACQRLKADQATQDIPVIFMTALADVESKIKGFEVGGVDYITKPIEYQELIARVSAHLTLSHLQKTLEEKNRHLQAMNQQLETKNSQLQEALDNVKTLRGLLPICANCKRIRDDHGYWHDVAAYIQAHSEAEFTHGICSTCIKELYPDYYQD
jgi:DNA-binding response OmpR family regulator